MGKKKKRSVNEVCILDLVGNYCEARESMQAVWSEIERISDGQCGELTVVRMDTEFIQALERLNDDLQDRPRKDWK